MEPMERYRRGLYCTGSIDMGEIISESSDERKTGHSREGSSECKGPVEYRAGLGIGL